MSLCSAIIKDENWSDYNQPKCDLRDAFISKVNFERANLKDSRWNDAQVMDCYMRGANLAGANLSYSTFIDCDFSYADLSGANLTGCEFIGVNLGWAKLDNVKIVKCRGNDKEIKTINIGPYMVCYTRTELAIGCIQKTITKWLSMEPQELKKLNVAYYLRYGNAIKELIERR